MVPAPVVVAAAGAFALVDTVTRASIVEDLQSGRAIWCSMAW